MKRSRQEMNKFMHEVLDSLPQFIDTLDDKNIDVFTRQENFDKILLGFEIVAKQTLSNLDSVQRTLDKLSL